MTVRDGFCSQIARPCWIHLDTCFFPFFESVINFDWKEFGWLPCPVLWRLVAPHYAFHPTHLGVAPHTLIVGWALGLQACLQKFQALLASSAPLVDFGQAFLPINAPHAWGLVIYSRKTKVKTVGINWSTSKWECMSESSLNEVRRPKRSDIQLHPTVYKRSFSPRLLWIRQEIGIQLLFFLQLLLPLLCCALMLIVQDGAQAAAEVLLPILHSKVQGSWPFAETEKTGLTGACSLFVLELLLFFLFLSKTNLSDKYYSHNDYSSFIVVFLGSKLRWKTASPGFQAECVFWGVGPEGIPQLLCHIQHAQESQV